MRSSWTVVGMTRKPPSCAITLLPLSLLVYIACKRDDIMTLVGDAAKAKGNRRDCCSGTVANRDFAWSSRRRWYRGRPGETTNDNRGQDPGKIAVAGPREGKRETHHVCVCVCVEGARRGEHTPATVAVVAVGGITRESKVGYEIRGRDGVEKGLWCIRTFLTPSVNRPLSPRKRGEGKGNDNDELREGGRRCYLACDLCAGDRVGNDRKEHHVALRKKGCCVSGKPRCRGGVGRSGCAEEGQDDSVKGSRGSEREPTSVHAYEPSLREGMGCRQRKRDTIRGWTRCRGRKGASGGASTGVRDRDQGESAPKRANDANEGYESETHLGGEPASRGVQRRREKERMEGSKSERAGGRGAVRQSGRPSGKQARKAGRQAGSQAGRQAGRLPGSQCTSQDH
ncbi:hypothetical protein X777_08286 [Ooceraea biroi]|uniref:Uncharacterized protein n=1 Tax=Ooceraea biroi TaxID=2015173 RepID=A0A026X114_OOCBI|nr:hypothetical protein X777_08286 [Ooceraea biroi]